MNESMNLEGYVCTNCGEPVFEEGRKFCCNCSEVSIHELSVGHIDIPTSWTKLENAIERDPEVCPRCGTPGSAVRSQSLDYSVIEIGSNSLPILWQERECRETGCHETWTVDYRHRQDSGTGCVDINHYGVNRAW